MIVLLLGPASVVFGADFKGDQEAIRKQVVALEQERNSLPKIHINPTPWTSGYRSNYLAQDEKTIQLKITFLEEAQIDLIAIMPSVLAIEEGQSSAFGFPVRFKIDAILENGNQTLIDYSDRDYEVSGIEPQLFYLAEPIEVTGLSIQILEQAKNESWWPGEKITAFSEILAFEEEQNVALGASVEASSTHSFGYAWHPDCLVDGFFLLSPASGQLHDPQQSLVLRGDSSSLLLDLGTPQEVDELRIWPTAQSLQHHFPNANGIGFPTNIHIEKISSSDARDGETIYKSTKTLPKPGSGPLMIRIPSTSGRYFRFILKDSVTEFRTEREPFISLSEIELLSGGQLVSAGLEFSQSDEGKWNRLVAHKRKLLTDGVVGEGDILPLREWVEGLNRQATLGRELKSLRAELAYSLMKEQERLKFIVALCLFLITMLVLAILAVKFFADRGRRRIRDQIACDLHDEIGANVSSLAHMIELIEEASPEPSTEQKKLIDQSLSVARQTASETRDFVKFLELNNEPFHPSSQIRETASQLLSGLNYECEINVRREIRSLPPAKQRNLHLFVKEALNNVVRHSQADRVEIVISKNQRNLVLKISDNGVGISDDKLPLRHLEARARQLQGELKIESKLGQSTVISLDFPYPQS